MRNHKITVRLDDREFAALKSKLSKTGLSQEALIRLLIRDYAPKEKPDDRFYIFTRQIIGISNNLQQICRKANALNFLDAPALEAALKNLDDFEADIYKRFLDPDKVRG